MATKYIIVCSDRQASMIQKILRLAALARCGDMEALQDLLGLSSNEVTDAILTLVKKEMFPNGIGKEDILSLTDERVNAVARDISDIERPIAQAIWDEGHPGVPQIKLDPDLPDQLGKWEPPVEVRIEHSG